MQWQTRISCVILARVIAYILFFLMKLSQYCCKDWGLLLIRLAVAFVFLSHGIQKLMNMQMVVGFFGMLGIPAFLAWVVAIGEVLAGLAVLLGAYMKWAGYFIAVVMVVALLTAKRKMGLLGSDIEITMLLVALGLSCVGAGRLALMGGSCGCGRCETKGDSCCAKEESCGCGNKQQGGCCKN